MVLDQISIIIKLFILGIFIAIMFDNISRYINIFASVIIWIPLICIICSAIVKITYVYEISYIIYYFIIFCFSYFVYYKYMKKDLNYKIDNIILYFKKNMFFKKSMRFIFFIDEFKMFLKIIKKPFLKIKNKKIKKD